MTSMPDKMGTKCWEKASQILLTKDAISQNLRDLWPYSVHERCKPQLI